MDDDDVLGVKKRNDPPRDCGHRRAACACANDLTFEENDVWRTRAVKNGRARFCFIQHAHKQRMRGGREIERDGAAQNLFIK